jgi:hypothetical protein
MNGRGILRLLTLILALLPVCLAGPVLNADITSSNAGATWSYTLDNNESAGSGNYIRSFTVTLGAFINVITSPAGWDFNSDFLTFITWLADDTPPFPFDVAPGASLGGFSIQSPSGVVRMNNAVINSWNHPLDEAGPDSALLSVSAPGSISMATMPEPVTWPLISVLAAVLAGIRIRYHPKNGRRFTGSLARSRRD